MARGPRTFFWLLVLNEFATRGTSTFMVIHPLSLCKCKDKWIKEKLLVWEVHWTREKFQEEYLQFNEIICVVGYGVAHRGDILCPDWIIEIFGRKYPFNLLELALGLYDVFTFLYQSQWSEKGHLKGKKYLHDWTYQYLVQISRSSNNKLSVNKHCCFAVRLCC